MQDELKSIISQAMESNSKLGQEPIEQFAEELSDEALEAVAGGVCVNHTKYQACVGWTFFWNGNNVK